jgi:hypothetical protein
MSFRQQQNEVGRQIIKEYENVNLRLSAVKQFKLACSFEGKKQESV